MAGRRGHATRRFYRRRFRVCSHATCCIARGSEDLSRTEGGDARLLSLWLLFRPAGERLVPALSLLPPLRTGEPLGGVPQLRAAFFVLFYVYPLKFIFAATFDSCEISASEARTLLTIWSLGYAAVFSVFALLYVHAWRIRAQLEMTPLEAMRTQVSLLYHVAMVFIALLTTVLVRTMPDRYVGIAATVYFLVPLYFTIAHSICGRTASQLLGPCPHGCLHHPLELDAFCAVTGQCRHALNHRHSMSSQRGRIGAARQHAGRHISINLFLEARLDLAPDRSQFFLYVGRISRATNR
jgi:hypothetical protein